MKQSNGAALGGPKKLHQLMQLVSQMQTRLLTPAVAAALMLETALVAVLSCASHFVIILLS